MAFNKLEQIVTAAGVALALGFTVALPVESAKIVDTVKTAISAKAAKPAITHDSANVADSSKTVKHAVVYDSAKAAKPAITHDSANVANTVKAVDSSKVDPFKGRMTRIYNVPGTTWQWTFDVTNHQLRNVNAETQRSYEDALANLTKFGRKAEANRSFSEIMKKDAVDGKIDNFEVVKNYVDSDIPKHSVEIFILKYRKDNYDMRTIDNPEDPAYLFGQGYGYLKLNNLVEAEQKLTQALGKTSDAHNRAIVYHTLGMIFSKEGREEDAIASYKEALRLENNLGNTHFNLGIKYSNKKDYNSAINEIRECLRIDPNDNDAKRNIEWVARKTEKKDSSEKKD